MSAHLRIQIRKNHAAFFFEVYRQHRPHANTRSWKILVHLMEGSQTSFFLQPTVKNGASR